MQNLIQTMLLGQYEASLAMLKDAVQTCPAGAWEQLIAHRTARWAAWHTLFCTDLYLSESEAAFKPHPLFTEGYSAGETVPSPGLPVERTLEYANFCIDKARRVIKAETLDTLAALTGFQRGFSRGEMHIYNVRHIQHHVGQLSAHARRHDPAIPDTAMDWIDSGAEWPPKKS